MKKAILITMAAIAITFASCGPRMGFEKKTHYAMPDTLIIVKVE